MKKFYSFAQGSALAVAVCTAALCAGQASAETLNYGYCTDEITGIGTGQSGTYIAGAIKIPAAQAQAFAGGEISTVSIGFGQSTPKRVTLFLSHELAGEPFYTQTANMKVSRFNDVPLLEPYTLTDEDLYVGYWIQTTTDYDLPIGVDKMTENYTADGDLISVSTTGTDGLRENWTNGGERLGNVSVRVLIDGADFSAWQQRAHLLDVLVPPATRTGYPFNVTAAYQNRGVEPITSLTFAVTIGDGATVTRTVTPETPVEGGKCGIYTLSDLLTEQTGDIEVKIEITEVNGKPNQQPEASLTRPMLSSPYLTNRPMVVEEATGIWCVWCPRGYVGLERMREAHHDDGTYIGIAVHNKSTYDLRNEPMHCESYQPWVTKYISGFPKCTINRKVTCDPAYENLSSSYTAITNMTANVAMAVDAEYANDAKTALNVTVKTHAPQEVGDHNLGIALVVTEDNVGPYKQKNAYAGSGMAMGGFENMGSPVSLMFNDVAREIVDWEGNHEALPATLEAGVDNEYRKTVSLANCDNPNNANIIALLIDKKTGEIVNGAMKALTTSYQRTPAVADAQADVRIFAQGDCVTVTGNDVDTVEVFAFDGRRVATLEGPGSIRLPRGIYLVTATAAGIPTTQKITL